MIVITAVAVFICIGIVSQFKHGFRSTVLLFYALVIMAVMASQFLVVMITLHIMIQKRNERERKIIKISTTFNVNKINIFPFIP